MKYKFFYENFTTFGTKNFNIKRCIFSALQILKNCSRYGFGIKTAPADETFYIFVPATPGHEEMKNFSTITAVFLALLFFACNCGELAAQNTDKDDFMQYIVEPDGDTVYISTLKTAKIYARIPKQKGSYWRKYYRDVQNFGKTYPYALMAKEILMETDSTIFSENFTRTQREKFIRGVEKELFARFEKPLRSMTVTQGKMLMKLIDREVGITSYNIIKDYKGGITAGFWQAVAKLFGSDLKKPYDKDGEDARLEELVGIWEAGEYEALYYSLFWKYPDFIPESFSYDK